jgi:hypothetical protein
MYAYLCCALLTPENHHRFFAQLPNGVERKTKSFCWLFFIITFSYLFRPTFWFTSTFAFWYDLNMLYYIYILIFFWKITPKKCSYVLRFTITPSLFGINYICIIITDITIIITCLFPKNHICTYNAVTTVCTYLSLELTSWENSYPQVLSSWEICDDRCTPARGPI